MLRWSEKSPQNTSMIAVPLSLESVRKTGKACFIILHGDPRCSSRRASASGNIFVNAWEVEMSGGFHLETILYHVKLNNSTCIKHWRESGVIFAQKNETHDLKHQNTRGRPLSFACRLSFAGFAWPRVWVLFSPEEWDAFSRACWPSFAGFTWPHVDWRDYALSDAVRETCRTVNERYYYMAR